MRQGNQLVMVFLVVQVEERKAVGKVGGCRRGGAQGAFQQKFIFVAVWCFI